MLQESIPQLLLCVPFSNPGSLPPCKMLPCQESLCVLYKRLRVHDLPAGMVGALCNNGIGVCGVNQVVKVMGCKFLDGSGNGYTSDAVRCLDYAQRMGADITLNSYGGLYADSYALQSAIQAAEDKGQLFVTAAGNDYGEVFTPQMHQRLLSEWAEICSKW